MSGIFGTVSRRSFEQAVDAEVLGMKVWNQPYGKKASDTIVADNYYLGCCLESINQRIKSSSPVIKKEGYYAVIDALIYNREELLADSMLTVDISDEELLIAYIEKNGLTSLKNINGDFAGAIYYYEKKELVLFRDHMGIRPLFYLCKDEEVAFSTDIRGILGILRKNVTVDEKWVYKTLSGYISTELEDTEYSDVFCVRPGSIITFSFSGEEIQITKSTYWELGKRKVKLSSDKEYQQKLRELITDSIKRRLDVVTGEVGAELSGGLDSGVISILINRLGRKCTYYSWSYSPNELPFAENDERLVIEDICKQENITCNYYEWIEGSEAIIENNIRDTRISVKEDETLMIRYAFPAYINTLKISETSMFMNKQGVRVIFTGHGGDEGVSHRANPYEMVIYREYLHYLRYVWSATHGSTHRVIGTIKKIRRNCKNSRAFLSTSYKEMGEGSCFLNKELKNKYKKYKASALYFAYDPKKYILGGGSRNRIDNVALQGAFCDVRYMIPYLDYRVINYAVSIPRYQFLRGRKNRYIFREAFKDIMPESHNRVTDKADNSVKSLKPDSNWYENFKSYKSKTISGFDKKNWSIMLDFSEIKVFENKGKPDEEEKERDYQILNKMSICLVAQKTLDKVRESSQKLSSL